jgi:hypothetical protein
MWRGGNRKIFWLAGRALHPAQSGRLERPGVFYMDIRDGQQIKRREEVPGSVEPEHRGREFYMDIQDVQDNYTGKAKTNNS